MWLAVVKNKNFLIWCTKNSQGQHLEKKQSKPSANKISKPYFPRN